MPYWDLSGFWSQVVNKWFLLQSSSDIPGNVENVKKLLDHPAFDLRNPNKASEFSKLSFTFFHSSILTMKPNNDHSGLLAYWRVLRFPGEFPCQRWIRLQVLGWHCCPVRQNQSSGLTSKLTVFTFVTMLTINILYDLYSFVLCLGCFSYGICVFKVEALWWNPTSSCQSNCKNHSCLFFYDTHNKTISISLREDVWINEAVVSMFAGTAGDDNVG